MSVCTRLYLQKPWLFNRTCCSCPDEWKWRFVIIERVKRESSDSWSEALHHWLPVLQQTVIFSYLIDIHFKEANAWGFLSFTHCLSAVFNFQLFMVCGHGKLTFSNWLDKETAQYKPVDSTACPLVSMQSSGLWEIPIESWPHISVSIRTLALFHCRNLLQVPRILKNLDEFPPK